MRRPLWESVVRLKSRAGEADLAVFQWWLKSLADDAQAVTLADRYRTHVEVPRAQPESLPIIAPADRALPRLKKPRYDLLHKYLRAHVPELRDLGEHFPSPERFDDYALRWLDVHLVGDGRMVVMAGGSAHGLHLFWLSASGFEKSAFIACDAFPGSDRARRGGPDRRRDQRVERDAGAPRCCGGACSSGAWGAPAAAHRGAHHRMHRSSLPCRTAIDGAIVGGATVGSTGFGSSATGQGPRVGVGTAERRLGAE